MKVRVYCPKCYPFGTYQLWIPLDWMPRKHHCGTYYREA